jgi:hypothetical protein
MKKCVFTLILLLISLITASLNASPALVGPIAPQKEFGRSFMNTRPGYQHLDVQQFLWHDVIYNKNGKIGGAVQVTPFYQQSIPLKKNAEYFLPACCGTISIAGDANALDIVNFRNVRAEWLGLPSGFLGTMSITPKERQYGASIEYSQDLGTLFDLDLLKSYWLDICMPIVVTDHSLNLEQNVVNAPANPGGPENIVQAFKQPAWCYARIDGSTKEVRLAQIKLSAGSALYSEDYFQFAYSSFLIIPLGNKQNARDVFQAIAGNNAHSGIGGSIFFQFPLNQDTTQYAICFFTNLDSTFNIRNHQWRTFDLIDKPWSRYMLYNEFNGSTNIPGVNILTRRALVRPYGVFDFSMGWRFNTDHIEAEIGYSIWGHSEETVKLHQTLDDPCQCYYKEFGIAGSAPNITSTDSTINRQALDDLVFISVKDTDLDPHSAANGSAVNHKIHFSLGGFSKTVTTVCFFGGGAYIDFPQRNRPLQVWGVWVKGGASF